MSASAFIISPGITLPEKFCQGNSATGPQIQSYVKACVQFLTSPLVSSLLACHPNDVAVAGPSREWESWWPWAAADRCRWKALIPGWQLDALAEIQSEIPAELKKLLETVDQLTLPRHVHFQHDALSSEGFSHLRGMSPKKSHEVLQMSSFVESVIRHHNPTIKHIVDVGAGQGYLSRALSQSYDVLALDFSEIQTKGSTRRTENIEKKLSKKAAAESTISSPSAAPGDLHGLPPASYNESPLVSKGSLTHELLHITSETLEESLSRWLPDQTPTPVMFVALHACGTLTPDIFRCFLANCNKSSRSHAWYPAGLVVVGCCYNLMSPDTDFPLSTLVTEENRNGDIQLHLSYNHRSLAAQSPLQWPKDTFTRTASELAIKKVVYRALYNRLISPLPGLANNPDAGSLGSNGRASVKLGRLKDSVYYSFQDFLGEANKKTGLEINNPADGEQQNQALESCLAVLHTLRSRIGPVIESLIIVDRYLYLSENAPSFDVLALNLFQQELGSGRNVALVILP